MSAAVERPSSWSAPKSRVGCDAEVLDACCGGRHWWWDKQHPLAVYMDERVVPLGNEWRAGWSCDPDIVGDFRAMPFSDETFQLVLFDPPHRGTKGLGTRWLIFYKPALATESALQRTTPECTYPKCIGWDGECYAPCSARAVLRPPTPEGGERDGE